jgi:single-strand DNA-binding protein
MINKVILIGNLGKDPEVRYLESNVAVARFSLATNESYKDKKGDWQTTTEWHNIVCWRNLAERAEKQLKKGSQIYVEGKLTHRTYQDKEGQERNITEVVANTIRILDRRDNRSSSGEEGYASEGALSDASVGTGSGGEQHADDDLPF